MPESFWKIVVTNVRFGLNFGFLFLLEVLNFREQAFSLFGNLRIEGDPFLFLSIMLSFCFVVFFVLISPIDKKWPWNFHAFYFFTRVPHLAFLKPVLQHFVLFKNLSALVP